MRIIFIWISTIRPATSVDSLGKPTASEQPPKKTCDRMRQCKCVPQTHKMATLLYQHRRTPINIYIWRTSTGALHLRGVSVHDASGNFTPGIGVEPCHCLMRSLDGNKSRFHGPAKRTPHIHGRAPSGQPTAYLPAAILRTCFSPTARTSDRSCWLCACIATLEGAHLLSTHTQETQRPW